MTSFLYIITVLIWGTTWIAIKFQLGIVPEIWSLIYRFGSAALLLFIYCWWRKYSLRFSIKQHCAIALQGLLLFSINYLLFYYASAYFISGIVAVIFASIAIMNIFNSRLFFKTPITIQAICGAIIGLIGLLIVFWSDIISTHSSIGLKQAIIGLVLCLGGALVASFGNILATYNKKTGLPIVETNTLGMAYATLFMILVAFISGHKPDFDWHASYIISLLYLSIFGSIIAFGAYISLLERIGPGKAGYAFVVIPLIALLISTFFENYIWDLESFIGITLILLGNSLVLNSNLFQINRVMRFISRLKTRNL